MSGKVWSGKVWILILATLLTVVGVFWPEREVTVEPGASAIVMFDVSQSMNTRDLRVSDQKLSRLAIARRAVAHAADNLPCGTALGYGIFAAHRALLLAEPVEVCRHRVEIKHAVSLISSRMAWHGNSEVAKGYYESLEIAAALKPAAAVVFISDGHEAPPLNRNLRPRFDGEVGAVRAVVAGVGGDKPVPIPKSDPDGRALGFWGPEEVLQLDRYSAGRISSESKASYVMPETIEGVDPRVVGTPGNEHLSSVREPYLKLLAEETEAVYARVAGPDQLLSALEQILALPGVTAFDVRRYAAFAALLALLIYYADNFSALFRRVRPRWNRSVSRAASN